MDKCEFAGVISSAEMLASIFLQQQRMHALDLKISASQVSNVFFCNEMLKTLQKLHVDVDVRFSVGQLNKVDWVCGKPDDEWNEKKKEKKGKGKKWKVKT